MPPARRSTDLPVDTAPMVWHGWGDPSHRPGLPAHAEAELAARIGPLGAPRRPVDLVDVRVATSALTPAQRAALVEVVDADHVHDDHRTRVEHAGGRSYPDLVRRRAGEAVGAPDAVVRPGDAEEVARLLDVCDRQGIAVVPFGGGTSVVGGVEPDRGPFDALVAVDVGRLDRLVELDETSHLATFQPGLRGAQAEALLNERGFTLGHFPQSHAYATLGGYVATRSAGQASTGYGRFDEMVLGVRCATPAGELAVGRPTASAAGPDLRGLLVGSEGILGVITQITLRVRPAPAIERFEGWAVGSFAAGAQILRTLAQAGIAADVVRLSDEEETDTALARAGERTARALRRYLALRGMERPCLLVLGWEGAAATVRRRRAATRRALTRHRAVRLGRSVGAAWARGRFEGPYLRDDLLDRGVMVETLETATSFARLGQLYLAVRDALTGALTARGTPPLVLCHVSHLYPTGASLYFTWLARQQPGRELDQWHAAKLAVSEAVVANHGTITHHHAVGTDHRAWMEAEIGPLGLEALRAVKHRLDPGGICNPGKLLPGDESGGGLTRADQHLP